MRQEERIKIRENMQVNKIYGIIHEKFSYGFSTLIKYTCIKYLSLLLGYTDKAALNSND